jgi:hypothetical protein
MGDQTKLLFSTASNNFFFCKDSDNCPHWVLRCIVLHESFTCCPTTPCQGMDRSRVVVLPALVLIKAKRFFPPSHPLFLPLKKWPKCIWEKVTLEKFLGVTWQWPVGQAQGTSELTMTESSRAAAHLQRDCRGAHLKGLPWGSIWWWCKEKTKPYKHQVLTKCWIFTERQLWSLGFNSSCPIKPGICYSRQVTSSLWTSGNILSLCWPSSRRIPLFSLPGIHSL